MSRFVFRFDPMIVSRCRTLANTIRKTARPKPGRPLRNRCPGLRFAFVEADPPRAFRDGSGIFPFRSIRRHLRAWTDSVQ